MIDYMIVEGHSSANLADQVKAKLHDGWQLSGNLVVVFNSLDGSFNFYQAMTKIHV